MSIIARLAQLMRDLETGTEGTIDELELPAALLGDMATYLGLSADQRREVVG